MGEYTFRRVAPKTDKDSGRTDAETFNFLQKMLRTPEYENARERNNLIGKYERVEEWTGPEAEETIGSINAFLAEYFAGIGVRAEKSIHRKPVLLTDFKIKSAIQEKSTAWEKKDEGGVSGKEPALEEGITSLVQSRYLAHWLSVQPEETRREVQESLGVESDRDVLAHRLWYAYPDSMRLVEFLARHVPGFETKLQNGRVNGRMLTLWKSVNQVFGAGAHEIVATSKEKDAIETIGVLAARLAATGNAQAEEDLAAAARELGERPKKAVVKSSGGTSANTVLGLHSQAASSGIVFVAAKSLLDTFPLPNDVRRSDGFVAMLFVNVLAHEMHHATGSSVVDLDLRQTNGNWNAKMDIRRNLASHVPGFSRREAERNEKIRVEREEFRKTHVGSQKIS